MFSSTIIRILDNRIHAYLNKASAKCHILIKNSFFLLFCGLDASPNSDSTIIEDGLWFQGDIITEDAWQ